MKGEKTLSDLIKDQVKLEKDIAGKLSILEERVDSMAARLLIREMQLDTKKHAEILETSLKAIGGPKSFWDYTIHIDADKRAVRSELEQHVKAEVAMISKIKEEIKKTKDETLKMLLTHFADDEEKHHKNLKTILNKTYKVEL